MKKGSYASSCSLPWSSLSQVHRGYGREGDLKNIAIQGPVNVQDVPQKIKRVLDEYEKFVDETLAGKRGKTTQFWMHTTMHTVLYTTIIDLTNVLHRTIKCKDPKLFGYALFKLLPIFFMTNHFNYARWMVLYL